MLTEQHDIQLPTDYPVEVQLTQQLPETHQVLLFDGMYLNSHSNVKFWAMMSHTYHFLKAILLACFTITYYHDDFRDAYFSGILIITICSYVLGCANFKLRRMCDEFVDCLKTADYLGHTLKVTVMGDDVGTTFANSRSPVYDAMNQVANYNLEQTSIAQKALAESIRNCYLARSKIVNSCLSLGAVINMCVIWDFVIIMGETEPNPIQKAVIILFILIELIIKIEYVTYMVLCMLTPIICLVLCVHALVSKPRNARNFAESLVAVDYDPRTTTVTDTQCTICYESFNEGDKVISLECHNKHTFHELCIKDWLKIGATCPLCRHDFSQQP